MEFLRLTWYVIRRRWPVVLVSLALCVVAGTIFSNSQPATYTASAQMFLRAPDVKSSASAYQGDLFSRQRAQTYMNLFSSDDLAKSVIDTLSLPVSTTELVSKVSAENIKDTVIIVVTATDPDPQQAANIANGYAGVFGRYVARMENVEYDPAVKPLVTVVKTASGDTAVRSGYSTGLVMSVAVLLALLISASIVYLLERYDTRVRSRRQIEALAGAPVIAVFDAWSVESNSAGGAHGAAHGDGRALVAPAESDEPAISDTARRALVGIRSRLSLVPESEVGKRSIVTVFGDSHAADSSRVTEVLAVASASVGDATVVIRPGDSPPPEPRTSEPVNPDEVLVSFADSRLEATRERIAEIGKEVDLALIDAPPLAESAGCDIAIESGGSALIVVRPGKTSKVALAEAAAKVSTLGRPVLGVVVTRAHETSTVNGVYI
ncbi:Wzz/FepE/Etk N-terminal domain-containing protein [Gordonia jinghuaiqii]|uniref:Wzz/FepE/Etk N-terminal domain-containing protein n=1 Tax=Gordonia jinghuaiqii TaxID=2758710 RepID=UPI001CB7A9DC|nr:Wzz/FepE/Etk N-terminal domain-containing protein [Gordonia jinghuaiqii]